MKNEFKQEENKDLIIDSTDANNIDVLDSEKISEDLLREYVKSKKLINLPASTMNKVYDYLVTCNKTEAVDNVIESDPKYYALIFAPALMPFLILVGFSGLSILILFVIFFVLFGIGGDYAFKSFYENKMDKMIKDISEDFGFLPADEYKKLKDLNKNDSFTSESVELEEKEFILNQNRIEKEEKRELDSISKDLVSNENVDKQNLDLNNRKIEKNVILKRNLKKDKIYVPEKLLFTKVNGVKKINDKMVSRLKYIDLSFVDFKDVDIRGIDFSNCNPDILDPQTIYNKDLSGTIFINDPQNHKCVFPFGVASNFDGVNLCNAQIISEYPILIDFSGAITDENTNIQIGNINYDDEKVKKISK